MGVTVGVSDIDGVLLALAPTDIVVVGVIEAEGVVLGVGVSDEEGVVVGV